MPATIQLVDLHAQHAEIRADIDAALRAVFDQGAFVLGPFVERFERAFADYVGVPHAVGVNSGTDALVLALDVVRHRRGAGRVITSPFTFFATAEAIRIAGHEVVFADIEPDTFNLDPEAMRAAAAPGTVAVLPVHLFGQCADMDALADAAWDVVEDAAQAVGAGYKGRRAGALGLFGAFSFYVTKNLGAAGDGGAVTTQDADAAALVRSLRAHGEVRAPSGRTYHYEHVGRNSRLDGLQAAVLGVKLAKLDDWQARRAQNAAFFDRELAGIEGLRTPAPGRFGEHVYHQYVVRAARRDGLRDHLTAAGIGTRVFYPEPLHVQPALQDMGFAEGSFPESERAAREVLSLPVHPHLGEEGRARVVGAVRGFYGA